MGNHLSVISKRLPHATEGNQDDDSAENDAQTFIGLLLGDRWTCVPGQRSQYTREHIMHGGMLNLSSLLLLFSGCPMMMELSSLHLYNTTEFSLQLSGDPEGCWRHVLTCRVGDPMGLHPDNVANREEGTHAKWLVLYVTVGKLKELLDAPNDEVPRDTLRAHAITHPEELLVAAVITGSDNFYNMSRMDSANASEQCRRVPTVLPA